MRGYFGIDPGTTGAAVFLLDDDQFVVHDWKNTREAIEFIQTCRCQYDAAGAAIEAKKAPIVRFKRRNTKGQEVDAIMGHKGTWLLSQSIGLWWGMLEMAGVKTQLVDPRTWQSAFGFLKRRSSKMKIDTKAVAMEFCRKRIPGACEIVYRKKDNHRADALLVAWWYRNQCRTQLKFKE